MPLTVRGKVAAPGGQAPVDLGLMADVARFWSAECLWHEHRAKRLERERAALEAWLGRWVHPDEHPAYFRRSARSRRCFAMALHHRAECERIEALLFEIVQRQPSLVQERMTAMWYSIRAQPAPPVRPTKRPIGA